ncbi:MULTISPECIES: DUF7096 domain-containing protein [Haloarcula]|uniref:Uncharacterized protein n=1 Tax=Haloarcula pellucida TaxID=1427151 RepID=A0A830GJW3_9EURY|nr:MULTISPECIES: hypothetical protein [Halomicroarcula]MBX0348837.1 hypothetical protein [Halomicroarcula pellucida]MDS0278600.1 hypothetical protein [Halomicroarcula sp. S1AR25-4]GGN91605.1 hypothetical protein GCM10009030_14710 [Halomicroarcula pellucida]
MRLLPALLVALLLASATAAPAAGWNTAPAQSVSDASVSPRITPIANTTNHLTIPPDEIQATGFNETGIDVGTAVASGSRQLHQRHGASTFEKRFRRADSEAARRQLVRGTLAAAERRTAQLRQRQQTAISRYAAGEISERELLRVRVLVDAESRALLDTLDRISAAQQLEPDYSMTSGMEARLRNIEGALQLLHGPVSKRVRATVTGASDASIVYVEGSSEGYMFATVDGSEYVRETSLGSERQPTQPDQFAEGASGDTNRLDVADNRASELYTWLYERQRPSFTYYGTSGIYELTANHPNGRLTAYLDGGTTNVFYELQHRQLATVQTTETRQSVNESLRLEVQRAYSTGPLFVEVTNNETGAPVDATVHIDGRRVGTGGTDGVLWTVEPRGEYTVTVTTANGTRTSVTVPER